MAKEAKTYCEYRGDIAVIHLGTTEDELLERFESCAQDVAGKEDITAVVVDMQEVYSMLSRGAGQFIIVNDILRETKPPKDMYVCNVHPLPQKTFEMLGILDSLEGTYLRGTLDEVLAELANGKQK